MPKSIIYAVLVLILDSAAALAFTSLDSLFVVDIVDKIVNQNYDEAIILADSVMAADEALPHGWFLIATTLNARMIDFEDEVDLPDWKAACDSVESRCMDLLSQNKFEANANFYIATVNSFRSYRYAQAGYLIDAYKEAVKGGKRFSSEIEMDSTHWDAYFGLGTYNYYRSEKAGVLRTIGVISDRREFGIRYIKTASNKGMFTATAASSALAWIAVESGDYKEAVNRSKKLLEKYPSCRSFMWCLGRGQIELGLWNEAINTYEKLLNSVIQEKRNNRFNEIGCLHSIIKAHFNLGQWKQVIQRSHQALAIDCSETVADRKSRDIRRIKKYLKQAEKKLKAKS